MRPPRVIFLFALLLFVALPAPSVAKPIGPAREKEILALMGDVGFARDLGADMTFDVVTIAGDHIVIRLRQRGAELGSLTLRDRADARPGDRTSRSFAIHVETGSDDPMTKRHLDALVDSVIAHDPGGFFAAPAPIAPHPAPPRRPPPTGTLAIGSAAVLLSVLLATRPPRRFALSLRPSHALPALLQTILLSYWALYYAGVRAHAPWIGVQLAYAYLLDAALQTRRDGVVRLGFAPLPIVLSMNLFVQFSPEHIGMHFAAITVALLTKTYVTRAGRHVYNPSAVGITAIAPLAILGGFDGDVAHAFTLAPNMTEAIVCVALVAQARFPIALASIGAVAGIVAANALGGTHAFNPSWAPVTLVLALFITDPATLPRTPGGRLLYGLFIGFGVIVASDLLTLAGRSDFYGKVVPVPLANAFSPEMDRLGSELALPNSIRSNAVAVAIWVAAISFGLTRDKRNEVDWARHAVERTRGFDPADPTCVANAVFCEPFSFPREPSLWRR